MHNYIFSFFFITDTIEISEFNDWANNYGHGRVLMAIKKVLDKYISSQTLSLASAPGPPCAVSTAAFDGSSFDSLVSWLTPVDPESDLAKRISMHATFKQYNMFSLLTYIICYRRQVFVR